MFGKSFFSNFTLCFCVLCFSLLYVCLSCADSVAFVMVIVLFMATSLLWWCWSNCC